MKRSNAVASAGLAEPGAVTNLNVAGSTHSAAAPFRTYRESFRVAMFECWHDRNKFVNNRARNVGQIEDAQAGFFFFPGDKPKSALNA